eukprot:1810112-Amphidinium_carterae.2
MEKNLSGMEKNLTNSAAVHQERTNLATGQKNCGYTAGCSTFVCVDWQVAPDADSTQHRRTNWTQFRG